MSYKNENPHSESGGKYIKKHQIILAKVPTTSFVLQLVGRSLGLAQAEAGAGCDWRRLGLAQADAGAG